MLKIKECLYCSCQVPFSPRNLLVGGQFQVFPLVKAISQMLGLARPQAQSQLQKKSENGELDSVGLISLALTIKPALSSRDIHEVGDGVRLSPGLVTPVFEVDSTEQGK